MKSKRNSTALPGNSASDVGFATTQPTQPGSPAGQHRWGSERGDAEARTARKTRILIVEDEPAMVAGLRDNFEFEGYEVISADNGVTGLERALADDPDLVVLDRRPGDVEPSPGR